MGYYCFVKGGGNPKYEHATLDKAYIEARRLASLGRRVFVMEHVGTVEPEAKDDPTVPQTKPRAEAGRVGEKV